MRIIYKTLLLVCIIFNCSFTNGQSNVMGSLGGEFLILPNGIANYSIPIEVVPGTQGVQPNLQVTYNSLSGRGILGQGWHLSGISSISRTQKTYYHDGEVSCINFENDDRYMVDGQRLIKLSSGIYSQTNAVYGSEIENFDRVVLKGEPYTLSQYFITTTDQGYIIEYGNTSDSKLISGDKIVSWFQNRITDPDGNYMTINYGQDVINGEIWPTEISYTGNVNANLTTYAKVMFIYTTDSNINVSYVGGKSLRTSKLLSSIRVIYGSELVRQYDFEYIYDRTTRLKSVALKDSSGNDITRTIIEWGYDMASDTLNITDYVNLSENNYIIGDFDGDSFNDAFIYMKLDDKNYSWKIKTSEINSNFSEAIVSGTIANVERFFKVDVDGDGKDEIGYIAYNDNTSKYDLKIIKFNGNSINTDHIVSNETQNIIWGDFLGNGKIHFLYGSKVGDNNLVLYSNNFGGKSISIDKNDIVSIVDFNGNGKSDIHLIKDGYVSIYEYYNKDVLSNIMNDNLIDTNLKGGLHGDFNADGKTDYLYYTANNFYIRYSNGCYYTDSVQLPFSPYLNSDNSLKFPVFSADINGDGKDDIIRLLFNYNLQTLTFHTYYTRDFNDNTYHYDLISNVYDGISTFFESHFQFVDLNYDGTKDMIYKATYNDIPKVVIFREKKEHNLIKSITNGLGKKVSLYYSYYNSPSIGYLGINAKRLHYPIVSKLTEPNGIGGYSETKFSYGMAVFDFERRQLLGFCRYNIYSNGINSQMNFKYNEAFHHLGIEQNISYIRQRDDSEICGYVADTLYWNINRSDFLHYETYNTLSYLSLSYKRFIQYSSISSTVNRLENVQNLSKIWLNTEGRIQSSSVTHYKSKQENHQSVWLSCDSVFTTYTSVTLPNGVQVLKPKVVKSWNIMNGFNQIPIKIISHNYSSGRLSNVSVSDSDGLVAVTSYSYNSFGLPIRMIITPSEMSPRTTTYSYDSKGRFQTQETNALGHTLITAYDEKNGRVISETDANNLTILYEYDVLGRIVKIIRPDQTQRNISYNWNNVNTYTNAVCYVQETETGTPTVKTYYDIHHRPIHTYTAGIGYNDIVYDQKGLVVKKTYIPYSSTTTSSSSKIWHNSTYDEYDRLIWETAPYLDMSYTYFDYNNPTMYDYFVTNTDNIRNVQYTKQYDILGRIVRATDNGGSIDYHYAYSTMAGKIVNKMTSSIGTDSTVIITDVRGNRISIKDPDAGLVTNEYDAVNQLVRKTDANGNVTTYTYDLLGRVTQEIYTNGTDTETITYTYDSAEGCAKGMLSNVKKNGKNEMEYVYDDLGRIINCRIYDGSTKYNHQYSYNTLGQLQYFTYPDGFKIEKSYNSYGELSKIVNAEDNTLIYAADTRNKFRQPLKCRLGNGTGVQYTYNDYGMLTGIKNGDIQSSDINVNGIGVSDPVTVYTVGNQYRQLTYTYNNRGLITSRSDSNVSQSESYKYDNLDRLVACHVNGNPYATYTYSDDGNIISNSRVGVYNYDSDKPHALTEINATTSAAISNFNNYISYNMRNRVGSIEENGYKLTFDYDAFGMRRHTYYWQNDSRYKGKARISDFYEVENKMSGGIRKLDYIYADGRIVAVNVRRSTTDSLYYVMTDHLGSWNKVMDENKNIVQETHFDPWGNRMTYNVWNSKQTQTSFTFDRGFTGHEHYDRFKIINTNARLYDPTVGRFFSPDPLVQAPDFTQSFNRYSYCLNNPIMYSDPDGESFVSTLIIGTMIGAFSGAVKAGLRGESSGNCLLGMLKGGFIGGLGTLFSGIGGAGMTFVENLMLGIAEGAFIGGVDAMIWNEDIIEGTFYGAISGAVYTTLTSDNLKNLIRGKGFKTNFNVFNDYKAGLYTTGDGMWQQDVLEYFEYEAVYQPLKARGSEYADSDLYFGSTNVTTGRISLGDLAFDSYDDLKGTYTKELYHSFKIRNNIELEMCDLSDLSTEIIQSYNLKYSAEEALGFLHAGYNKGLYPKSTCDFFGQADAYNTWIGAKLRDKHFYDFIFQIPRRW